MSRIPKHADEAVFPQPHRMPLSMNEARAAILPAQWGLTKREYFAAAALQGISANPHFFGAIFQQNPSAAAAFAIEAADALLDRLALEHR